MAKHDEQQYEHQVIFHHPDEAGGNSSTLFNGTTKEAGDYFRWAVKIFGGEMTLQRRPVGEWETIEHIPATQGADNDNR